MTLGAHFESSFNSLTRLLDADFNFHREFRLLVSPRTGLKMENKNQQLNGWNTLKRLLWLAQMQKMGNLYLQEIWGVIVVGYTEGKTFNLKKSAFSWLSFNIYVVPKHHVPAALPRSQSLSHLLPPRVSSCALNHPSSPFPIRRQHDSAN